MPDVVRVELFIAKPMKNEKAIRAIMAAFRDFPKFALTHWSPEDQRSLPAFVEETAVRGVLEARLGTALAIFKRNKKPKFEGDLTASNDELNNLSLKFGKLEQDKTYQQVFEFCTALAERVGTDFGFVHPIWYLGKTSQEYSASGIVSRSDIDDYGLRSFCARTWINERLAGLLGDAMKAAGLMPTVLPSGLRQVDLMANPWEGDFLTLSSQRMKVMKHLMKTGLFADYSKAFDLKEGKNWTALSKAGR